MMEIFVYLATCVFTGVSVGISTITYLAAITRGMESLKRQRVMFHFGIPFACLMSVIALHFGDVSL